MKLDLLVFGAHPDDVELGCGGTVAKEVARGKRVGIIDLTQGELGTRGNADTRFEEATNSAEILGVKIRENLGFADGFFVNDRNHQLQVITMIRKYRPEMIICNAITDRHIDHGRGSQLVSDACFLSGLVKIETEYDGKNQEQWRPKAVYHYIQWKNISPDITVDISDFIETKMKSVMSYKTQFHDPDSDAPETPISSLNFAESIKYRARDLGRLVGVEYAEGFTVERLMGVDSLFDLK